MSRNRYRRAVIGLVATTCLALATACPEHKESMQAGSHGGDGSGGAGAGKAGAGGDANPSTQASTSCTKLCALAEPLHCPGDSAPCMDECTALYDAAKCRTELRALIDCSIGKPASEWACNANDEADVSADSCSEEKDAAQACVGTSGGGQQSMPTDLPAGVAVTIDAAADPGPACDAIWACKAGLGCSYPTDGPLLSKSCVSAIEAASCDDDALDTPSWYDKCFPSCKDPIAHCNGDGSVTLCTRQLDGAPRWISYSCDTVCMQQSLEFKGTCKDGSGANYREDSACACVSSE